MEEFWVMKARILWLVEGDRYTSFCHTSTIMCQKRNRISCMKDGMGNWLNGGIEIADFIRQGFLDLFTSSQVSSFLAIWDPPVWNTRLNTKANLSLKAPITNREISKSLWVLKPFKASNPNGLHAGFFQRFWLIVGDSVKEEVKRVFSSGVIPGYMNQTLIILIPKCRSPDSLSNYRPISLCNMIRKIVTKIVVNWSTPCCLI